MSESLLLKVLDELEAIKVRLDRLEQGTALPPETKKQDLTKLTVRELRKRIALLIEGPQREEIQDAIASLLMAREAGGTTWDYLRKSECLEILNRFS